MFFNPICQDKYWSKNIYWHFIVYRSFFSLIFFLVFLIIFDFVLSRLFLSLQWQGSLTCCDVCTPVYGTHTYLNVMLPHFFAVHIYPVCRDHWKSTQLFMALTFWESDSFVVVPTGSCIFGCGVHILSSNVCAH